MELEIEKNLANYFEKNDIPYHWNALNKLWKPKSNQKHVIRTHFVIPGKIILPATYQTLRHSDGQIRIEKALMTLYQIHIIQKIIILIHTIPDDVPKDSITTQYLTDYNINTFNLSVTLTADMSTITAEPYIYYISSNGPIYTLAMKDDISYFKNLKVPLQTTKEIYTNSIIFMTEEEQQRLSRIPLEILDTEPQSQYYVSLLNSTPNGHKFNYLHEFVHQLPYCALPGGTRTPLRYIPNITDYCSQCKSLYKVKYINEDKVCIKCKNKITQNQVNK
jgi:hypothetical protein